ncbi:DUF7286 family protein [Halorussus lipolyticus]|uniref:DUF7286 family protein n=1 Tax=Halorussus lipolyticus TaxID=3034024 RepID=UPI0023E7596D|nr:hypothetical protein [Halorussus sp. DT80]
MRFAEDRRARVPFALAGVLLLVGSAALSASLAGKPAPETDESVGLAVERAKAASSTTLRRAITRAGRQAARNPVTHPANTTLGRVLNDSTPYRDSLRIRIYLAVREDLDSVGVRVGDVEGEVSLSSVSNASDLRRAKRRVSVQPAGTGDNQSRENAGLRVRVENITVSATRDNRVVEREEFSPTLVVATPALALHERTERFESRLNRGPLVSGLGRRLTARLYGVSWVRGYAQYGGAPVQNVVANRHVELAVNGGLLREQRAVFGRSDPAGRRALGWATARVGAIDLLTAANTQYGSARTDQLLTAAKQYQRENPMPGGVTAGRPGDSARRKRNGVFPAGVNRTADRAFSDLVKAEEPRSGDGPGSEERPTLGEILRSSYTVDARLVAAVERTEAEERPAPASPGANWTLAGTEVRTTTRTEAASGPPTGPPGPPRGWHLLGSGRGRYETTRVVRTHALVANWTRGNESRRTVRRWSETFVTRIGVAGDHSVDGSAVPPSRPIGTLHDRGGPLDGPNLAGIPDRATDRLVRDRGGHDALARRAVAGTLDTRPEKVAGRRPPDLREWVYRDAANLREKVRNISIGVPRQRVLGERPPPAQLAQAVRAEREDLLDAPARYDGVADRARVAVRTAYLDRVVARLEARASRQNRTRVGVGEALADAGRSLDEARRTLRARTTPETRPRRPMGADGPGAPVNLSVSGAPPYLTLAKVDHEEVAVIPEGERRAPLSARNRNVFAVPYGDAAETVASAVAGDDGGAGDSKRVSLRTGAVALRTANRTLAERENRSLERRRNRLQQSLAESMREARRMLVAELALTRFDLTRGERRVAVHEGLARWNTTAGRALAVANGSAADAIASAVIRRRPALDRPDRRDWVGLRAELAVEATSRTVEGPPRSAVNQTTTVTQRLAENALKQAITSGLGNATELASKRWFGEVLGAVPAGLPVAPVPGYWYATVNVWTVEVSGQYARFSVSAPQGPPGEEVRYVRENATVRVDVDGDGERDLLGRTAPVAFETGTTVVVVVPPGPPGVGDRGGNRDESSPGWNSG